MRIEIPRLRLWHLIGFVAANAAFLGVMQFRWSVEDASYSGIRQLRSLDALERLKAAGSLGGIKPPDRRAISPLAEALFDGDSRVRAAAAESLSMIVRDTKDPEAGFVKAALTSALGDRDLDARRAIALALANFDPDPGIVVSVLIDGTGQGSPEARAGAVEGLRQYARKSEPARRAILAAIRDPDITVRFRAVHSSGNLATSPDLAAESILGPIKASAEKAADDESPIVRMAAVYVLGNLASLTGVENPRVIDALRDPDAVVRQQAATYLSWSGRSGKRSAALVPSLILALKDQDKRVRQASASTLGELGTAADTALSALRVAANDPEQDVREKVEQSISTIEKADGVTRMAFSKALVELGDADPDARALATDWFGGAGSKGAEAIPALVRCLSDREADVRRSAAGALGQLGPAAAAAVPNLTALAESDPDERVRQAASLSRTSLLREAGGEASAP